MQAQEVKQRVSNAKCAQRQLGGIKQVVRSSLAESLRNASLCSFHYLRQSYKENNIVNFPRAEGATMKELTIILRLCLLFFLSGKMPFL